MIDKHKYRPKGWYNPYLQKDENGDYVNSRVYESGADAMLDRLRSDSKQMKAYVRFVDETGGTWVFIPDHQ